MYIVSACLAGRNCRYNGQAEETPWIKELTRHSKCVLVCPEDDGNLPTPRPPAERIGDRILNKEGKDVTDAFYVGAEKSLATAKISAKIGREEIHLAILKANSPSCGCGTIYDGTFSGKLIQGDGVFAAMLKEEGITVISEKDEDQLKQYRNK